MDIDKILNQQPKPEAPVTADMLALGRAKGKSIALKIMHNVGTIGAILSGVCYIAVVALIVFSQNGIVSSLTEYGIFLVINGLFGLMINNFLRLQGTIYARNLEENKRLLELYKVTKTKQRKLRNISYYWRFSIIKDVLVKLTMSVAMASGVIYIAVIGSKDITLLLLAFCNLVMFVSLGMVSMGSGYEFFNNEHMAWIENYLKDAGVLVDDTSLGRATNDNTIAQTIPLQ